MENSKTQSRVTPEIRELISLTATSAAEETTKRYLVAASGQKKYYRAVEALLYNYCKLQKLVEIEDGRAKAQFEEVERVISLFRERKEFIVIRMYYFNQDVHGNEHTGKYTFEEITEELSEFGLLHDAKTARRWCNSIINDMAVCMFGMPAAISAATEHPQ